VTVIQVMIQKKNILSLWSAWHKVKKTKTLNYITARYWFSSNTVNYKYPFIMIIVMSTYRNIIMFSELGSTGL
jgi:hypothetical protein